MSNPLIFVEKDLAAYQVKEADYEMAISSLKGAIKSMKDSRPSAAVLLSIRQTVALAETWWLLKEIWVSSIVVKW